MKNNSVSRVSPDALSDLVDFSRRRHYLERMIDREAAAAAARCELYSSKMQ